jgi:hypothetical protein
VSTLKEKLEDRLARYRQIARCGTTSVEGKQKIGLGFKVSGRGKFCHSIPRPKEVKPQITIGLFSLGLDGVRICWRTVQELRWLPFRSLNVTARCNA